MGDALREGWGQMDAVDAAHVCQLDITSADKAAERSG
jgi:hypothetical protein